MKVEWTENGLEDFRFWESCDAKKFKKIKRLIVAIKKNPKQGIGKPEPLKYNLSGCWSRRIDREHRLVYQFDGQKIIILACRYHYG